MTLPDLVYLVVGIALFLAVLLPSAVKRLPMSAPMVLVLFGLLLGLTPLPDGWVDPVAHRAVVEHLTELCVLVALMGVGLALDRPISLRNWRSLASWSASWRLLLVAMPLTIAGVALAGWSLMGLAPASALLLGAALAPTDPVLASDVQVDGPTSGVEAADLDEEHEVRFGLTAEAGMNDGLAFPFVYAAITWVGVGHFGGWAWHWLWWDLLARVVIGVAVGIAVGWVLGRLAFRAPRRELRALMTGEPLLALACLAISYGAAEAVHGYGFLAVFCSAVTLRWLEPEHEYHAAMHQVTERLETLLTLLMLLLIGLAPTSGGLVHLSWGGVAVGLLLVLVIRPAAGWLSLAVRSRIEKSAGVLLTRPDMAVMSFFGVRGIGTIYYLAYASGQADFPGMAAIWTTAAFTIVLSVLLHGATAGPAMDWLERRNERIEGSGSGAADQSGEGVAAGGLPRSSGVVG